MSITSFVKRIQDITRNDAGVNGDAQRIEQMSWLLFLKIYDSREMVWELEEDEYESIIPEELKWRNWAHAQNGERVLTGDELLDFVNNKLFKELKELEITSIMPIRKTIVKSAFEDANNYMKNGVLLRQVINVIDEVDFNSPEDRHSFNDIYEKILKDIQNAGNSGEFYTPRAATDFIAEVLNPKLGESMADLACGTGGFLTSTLNRLSSQRKTSEDTKKYNTAVFGIEKKAFPHLLAVTNLFLHEIDDPKIVHGNTLEKNVREYTDDEKFDIIMMNPPFGGSELETIKNNFPAELRSSETADFSYYGNKDETSSYPIYKIPEAWRYIKFASLVNFRIGKTPPRSEATFWGTEIPWVSISDMPISGYVTNTRESISKLALKSKKIDISPKGTLLMSFKLSIGKVAILDIPATHNEAIISIFPYANKENIIRDYLMIFLPLISTLGDSKDAIKGKTLNSTSISELLIPISNHEEMKRIISKVDLLFQKVSQLFE
ncbi:TPA: N-6 DNA methylase [Streptococcus pneumoniae]